MGLLADLLCNRLGLGYLIIFQQIVFRLLILSNLYRRKRHSRLLIRQIEANTQLADLPKQVKLQDIVRLLLHIIYFKKLI